MALTICLSKIFGQLTLPPPSNYKAVSMPRRKKDIQHWVRIVVVD